VTPEEVRWFRDGREATMSEERKIASSVGETVKSFYDNYGWQARAGGGSNEDVLFRLFPEAHKSYANNADARTAACFDGWDGSMLIAGCGDMPDFHLALAKRFNRVLCMDVSPLALSLARTKLGDKAEYLEQSILDTVLADNSVDTVYCAHVIYHIEERFQEMAVNQLIRITKKGGRIMVVYVTPSRRSVGPVPFRAQ
jgi:SAM-dependent methyltransferase